MLAIEMRENEAEQVAKFMLIYAKRNHDPAYAKYAMNKLNDNRLRRMRK